MEAMARSVVRGGVACVGDGNEPHDGTSFFEVGIAQRRGEQEVAEPGFFFAGGLGIEIATDECVGVVGRLLMRCMGW